MKKTSLLFLFSTLFLLSCSGDDSSNDPTTFNSFDDFQNVIYRFQIFKNPDINAHCNSNIGSHELRVSRTLGIYIGYENFPTGQFEIIDDETNNEQGIYLIDVDDYVKLININKIKIRTSDNQHDFSFFESLNDTTEININVTNIDYFDTSGRYRYEDNDIEFSGGFWEYIEDVFHGYKIEGNTLILLHPIAL